ncbi:hypothetical protein FB99_45790 (plasmid) [Pantoea agglomerans]|nr:hypothetical protein FB99_45790 [Pantoea agglomerans]
MSPIAILSGECSISSSAGTASREKPERVVIIYPYRVYETGDKARRMQSASAALYGKQLRAGFYSIKIKLFFARVPR